MNNKNLEIERKFLPKNEGWLSDSTSEPIEVVQGYLKLEGDLLRVRTIKDNDKTVGFLTIKNKIKDAKFAQEEMETTVELDFANYLLGKCGDNLIKKTRYFNSFAGHIFSIDKFDSGLTLIEVEIASEDEVIDLPEWVGEEVTGNPEYFNANMIKRNV